MDLFEFQVAIEVSCSPRIQQDELYGLYVHFRIEAHFGNHFLPIMHIFTPCACAARGRVIGLSVSLSVQVVCRAGLSSEGLVEGLFQDRSVRI